MASPLDIVANQEPKALTYMGLLDLGEATHTALGQHMVERFGIDGIVSVNSIGAYTVTFAKHNFANIDEKESMFNARIVRYFEPLAADEVVPWIGATLGWSHKYKGIPLDWMLSETSSSSSRGPSNSIAILETALEGSKVTLLAPERYAANTANTSRLRDLIRNGVLVEEPVRVKIDNPTYTGNRPFDSLTFTSQHLYTSLGVAKEIYPDKEWTLGELLDFTIRLLPQHLRRDEPIRAKLAHKIRQAASLGSPRDFSGAIHKVGDIRGMTVKVADEYSEPVADLVERIHLIDTSPSKRTEYRDIAFDIYGTIPAARALILKACQPPTNHAQEPSLQSS